MSKYDEMTNLQVTLAAKKAGIRHNYSWSHHSDHRTWTIEILHANGDIKSEQANTIVCTAPFDSKDRCEREARRMVLIRALEAKDKADLRDLLE